MKGLLVKDFRYLLMQKNFIAAIMVIAIANALFLKNVSFPLGFITFVISLYTINTMSYDEFDNGNAFLFTLPITRAGYIKEKYVLGIILVALSMTAALGISLMVNIYVKEMPQDELVGVALVMLAIVLMLLSVNIPVHLKFGGEKGMTAMFTVYGLIILAGIAVYMLFHLYTGKVIADITAKIEAIGPFKFGAALFVCSAAALGFSFCISQKIIKDKEF